MTNLMMAEMRGLLPDWPVLSLCVYFSGLLSLSCESPRHSTYVTSGRHENKKVNVAHFQSISPTTVHGMECSSLCNFIYIKQQPSLYVMLKMCTLCS
jgi:hypothetical protein